MEELKPDSPKTPNQESGPIYTEEDFKSEVRAWSQGQIDHEIQSIEKLKASGVDTSSYELIAKENQEKPLDDWIGEYIDHHMRRVFHRLMNDKWMVPVSFVAANPEEFSLELLTQAKRFMALRDDFKELAPDIQDIETVNTVDQSRMMDLFVKLRNIGYSNSELTEGYSVISHLEMAYNKVKKSQT